MNALNDYYRLEKKSIKSRTRLDCIASTSSYTPFERLRAKKGSKATTRYDEVRAGDLIMYYGGQPHRFKGTRNGRRSTTKAISAGGKNITSVLMSPSNSKCAWGDYGEDVLFFILGIEEIDGVIIDGYIEIFIARNKKNDLTPLFNLFCDGGLNDEIEELRKNAILLPI